jgi:hypothetical protein
MTVAFGQEWQKLPGQGTDIGAGADGSLWVVGTQGDANGNSIYQFNKDDHIWIKLESGSAVNISVGPKGIPWIVNKKGEIFRQKGKGWEQLPGNARDVGIGGDGTAWITGTEDKAGGGIVSKWKEADFKWVKLTGEGVMIEVGPKGLPWLINKKNEIYRKKGTTWQKMPGSATDIGVGADGSVWAIGGGGKIYKWNEADFKWEEKAGNGARITVGSDGTVYIVNAKNEIYQTKTK